ncbi:DUF3667 domain-containing protein [Solilutibacter tolerans]|uniref:DUF3667 domain-containing protein n=1 Tax=Solilutibacter tolerans TaxID=1604334 RepID=A0A1N6NAL9_9GAMM|nr:DUF3667 domain-containing protein [Lysobacter tolerans]SIP89118.1 Protein of unknown function [Lysobacter tolerans]
MEDTQNCRNCDRVIDVPGQKFCPNCGQATPTRRIDWRFLGHELEHSVLHMNKGILYSLKQLMLRPGYFIHDYLDGKRVGIVKPMLLVVMMGAAATLIAHYLLGGDVMGSSFHQGLEAGTRLGGDPSDEVKAATAATAKLFTMAKDWINQHLALVTLLMIPVQAAGVKLAFRRFSDVSYPEWLVIGCFLNAQSFVLWSVFMPIQRVWSGAMSFAILLAIAYNLFSLMQFFKGYPRWKAGLRGLLGFAFFQVVMVIFTFFVMFVIGVLMGSGHVQIAN